MQITITRQQLIEPSNIKYDEIKVFIASIVPIQYDTDPGVQI